MNNNPIYFFAYAKHKKQNRFRLFSLKDNRTYFKKSLCPRYQIKDIELLKEFATKLVELNKNEELHIKFITTNNKVLFQC